MSTLGNAASPRRILAIAVTLGVALRLAYFLSHPSLYIDEARLALNIAGRTYFELAGKLDYDQSAPLLFLWIERAVGSLGGFSDLALRIVPVAAGIGAIFLQRTVAGRLMPPAAAVFATLFIAVSPAAVGFSGSVKQYSTDALVTLGLLGVALPLVRGSATRSSSGAMVAASLVAPWLSAPSVFILFGIVTALAVRVRRLRTGYSALLGIATAAALSSGTAYFLTYRAASQNAYLKSFWAGTFLSPWVDGFWVRLRDIGHDVLVSLFAGIPIAPLEYHISGYSLALTLSAIGLVLLIVAGLFALAQAAEPEVAVLLGGPLVGVLAAAGIEAYPLGLRSTLFLAPVLHLLAASGIWWLTGRVRCSVRSLLLAAVSLGMILMPLGWSLGLLVNLSERGHVRALVEQFRQHAGPTEPVYVFAGSLPAWVYYTTDWRAPDRRRLKFMAEKGTSGGGAFENAGGRSSPVVNEGQDLVYHHGDRMEILGVYSGMQWLTTRRMVRYFPDRGWVENEAARIRAAAHPTAWLVFSQLYGPELRLIGYLERGGAVQLYRKHERSGFLFQYCFPQNALRRCP